MAAKMESMTMRELRDTRKLEAKLQAGKIIELRKRNRAFARITPLSEPELAKKIEWPDFEARARKILGDRILPGADLLIEGRGRD
jgi:antitoxin (DNA-binding transcriptional repressor) of toxin-antitoxin stability system